MGKTTNTSKMHPKIDKKADFEGTTGWNEVNVTLLERGI